MNERTAPEDVFSKRSKYYATSTAHTDPQVLDDVVRMAMPERNMLALDVGTGTGHTAIALAPHVSRVIALDVTREMIDEGMDLCAQKGVPNVEFQLGDAMALPYRDHAFDIVTCRRAAHHFTDIERAIYEMRRVLVPGGRLVIDDRSVPPDDEADDAMNRLDVLHDPSHVREYRRDRWIDMLESAGMAVTETLEYRRRVPMLKFTEGLDEGTAQEMYDLIARCSAHCRSVLNAEKRYGDVLIDHFFVMLSATRD